jgi:hypothetical protein
MHTKTHWFTISLDIDKALEQWLAAGYAERDLFLAYIDRLETSVYALKDEFDRVRVQLCDATAEMSRRTKDEVPWIATEMDRQARNLWNTGLRTKDPQGQERLLNEALALWAHVAAEKRAKALDGS